MTRLEILEKQSGGRVHQKADYDRAYSQWKTDPQGLTDLDLALIAHFGGAEEEAKARAAKSPAPASASEVRRTAPPAQARDIDPFGATEVIDAFAGAVEAVAGRFKDATPFLAEAPSSMFRGAYRKIVNDPATLSDDDFRALSAVDPDLAERAKVYRTDAADRQAHRRAAELKSGEPTASETAQNAVIDAAFGVNDLIRSVVTHRLAGLYEQTKALQERVAALEALQHGSVGKAAPASTELLERVKAVESHIKARPGIRYCGIFTEGTTYETGDAVTWGGSLFIARSATVAKPGLPTDPSRAWTLAAKRGSDGKAGVSV